METQFEVNGQSFTIDYDNYTGCYGRYTNRGTHMQHRATEPEDFNPNSISEEWKHLPTIADFIWFVQNAPNKGAYSPSAWSDNVRYFIFNEATSL